MSFHPYSIRPIGTEKFNQYLVDLFTSIYYYEQDDFIKAPKDEKELVKIAATGESLWKQEDEIDPMDRLVMAVTATAMRDYVEYYEKREKAKKDNNFGAEVLYNSRCLTLENDFFRKWEWTELVFEKLLKKIYEQKKLGRTKYHIRICDTPVDYLVKG